MAGLLLVALLCLALWLCHVMKQTPLMAGPERFGVCGRLWSGPDDGFTAAQLGPDAVRLGAVWTWQGKREVWGHRVTEGRVTTCGTGVYLKVSNGQFLGYDLLGGL